jgi:hypothetical protein
MSAVSMPARENSASEAAASGVPSASVAPQLWVAWIAHVMPALWMTGMR